MVGVEECIDNNLFEKYDCGDEEEGNDDDCMVMLPWEEKSNFKEAVESDSNFKEAVESYSDNDRFWVRNKRRCVGV